MAKCEKCNGQGLVSTGADPLDLSVGSKQTCAACAGTGRVEDAVEQEAAESPKAGEPSGDGSSEGAEGILPKEGDPCVMADGETPGVLRDDGEGRLVCVAE